jgi:predicted Rossmann fold flavoprotein
LGTELLEKIGHGIEPLFPALVPLKTEPHFGRRVKGIKVRGRVLLIVGDRQYGVEEGEVHFSDYGLSGPPVIQLSYGVGRALQEGGSATIILDLFPDWGKKELVRELKRRHNACPGLSLDRALTGLVHKRLLPVVIRESKIGDMRTTMGAISPAEIESIADCLKGWSFSVRGSLSWREAQVMGGGIRTADFSPHTLESHQVPGLYAAGEVLDVTGDSGGFNLQWAWSSGYVAGLHAATDK